MVAAAASARSAPQRFGDRQTTTLIRQLAQVGVGTYADGKKRPLWPTSGAASPVRLTLAQTRAAALGVWAHSGSSGSLLDELAPPLRLTSKLRIPTGALVAGWARRAHTPAARLARKLLGPTNWKAYRAVVFPDAVLMLFVSDITTQLPPPVRKTSSAFVGVQAVAQPCSAVLSFVNNTIEAVFKAIGHLNPDTNGLRRAIPFLGEIIAGAVDTVFAGVNAVIDAAHFLVVEGVKIAIGAVAEQIAAVAGAIDAVGEVALFLRPWTANVTVAPNPTAKGIGGGIPGTAVLDVTAPGSNLEWPTTLTDCAKQFNLNLPPLTPQNADVHWDSTKQSPSNLLVNTASTATLDQKGRASLTFETTTETAAEAKGNPALGIVTILATIHRRDLDQLRDRLSASLLGNLPAIIRATIGPVLQGILKPIITAATSNLTHVQDIQTSVEELVRYHTPKKDKTTPGHAVYSVTVPSQIAGYRTPLLDAYTCKGLHGPWHGTLDEAPPSQGRQPLPISFSLDSAFNGRFAGQKTASRPGTMPGDTITETNSWVIPVHVDPSHLLMTFPAATLHGVELINPPGTKVDSGVIAFRPLATTTYRITTTPRSEC